MLMWLTAARLTPRYAPALFENKTTSDVNLVVEVANIARDETRMSL
jgi:hypothetical protein